MNKIAIITGASKGIGRELAILLSSQGYQLGLMARSENLLKELSKQLVGRSIIKAVDISDVDQTILGIHELINELGGLDLMIANAGVGFLNPSREWLLADELQTIEVNVKGFVTTCDTALRYFLNQQKGHLVGIASIAGVRGYRIAPCYHASKAFESIYLDSLRHKVNYQKLPISITEIRPGFVDTELAQTEPQFWVASPQKAAQQIYQVILKKKRRAYITKRWKLISYLMKIPPAFLYEKF